ncbi:MAG TPA: carbonic anhydrase [Acidimicrobiales bacterium]|nr:carbonic anhydrase [Acidimicrobiales bacterium]
MSEIDDLVERNRAYVARHGHRELPTAPSRRLAVVTCMDSRLDLFGALGLDLGEVHVVRNAGGQATEDVLRSLLLSQRLLGTRSVMVVHHTRCGLEGLDDEAFRARVAAETGHTPTTEIGAFTDVDADVRATVTAIRESPLLDSDDVRGFVFDVDDGELREVH